MTFRPEAAARWLAEAVETGNPLRDLPGELAPPDQQAGEAVAIAVLDSLGLTACGVRLLWRGAAPAVAGPMLEGRLIDAGRVVAPGALRHPLVSAAAIGVLAEALEAEGDAPPRFAALHPAIDIAASRFSAAPEEAAVIAADLGGLGLVVAGRSRAVAPGALRLLIGPVGTRRRAQQVDLAAAFAEAAAAARRFGGLPAGALLVVAGLSPALPAEGAIAADLGPLGKLDVAFA
jgi:hypothetical protein